MFLNLYEVVHPKATYIFLDDDIRLKIYTTLRFLQSYAHQSRHLIIRYRCCM